MMGATIGLLTAMCLNVLDKQYNLGLGFAGKIAISIPVIILLNLLYFYARRLK